MFLDGHSLAFLADCEKIPGGIFLVARWPRWQVSKVTAVTFGCRGAFVHVNFPWWLGD